MTVVAGIPVDITIIMDKYSIWLFILLTSLATSSIELDGNGYAKLFAFGLIVVFFSIGILCRVIRFRGILFCKLDAIVCLLFAIYLIESESGIFNLSIPILSFILYLLVRISGLVSVKPYFIIAPIIIILQICICILQEYNFVPNFNALFKVGGTFGNPDMLGAYLALLIPSCYINVSSR